MFLRATTRRKDGKIHRYWSVVENCRTKAGRVVQRHVLYLGEINDAQKQAWCKTIEMLEEGRARPTQVAIYPQDRQAPEMNCAVVQVRLDRLRLERPRQWGAYWLAMELWGWLQLDEFWAPKLPASRKGTEWLHVLKTLVVYQPDTLYRRMDLLLAHKRALFGLLKQRWESLFEARFEVLLYDLTSTACRWSMCVCPPPMGASSCSRAIPNPTPISDCCLHT